MVMRLNMAVQNSHARRRVQRFGRSVIFACLAAIMWACSATPTAGVKSTPKTDSATHPSVQVVELPRVENCEYLGKVAAAVELDGPTAFLELYRDRGIAKCRSECLAEASKKGATHLVWDKLRADHAIARIYKCTN